MSITLYHGEPNGPSLTVLAALFEKGVAATLSKIDLAAGARHDLAVAHQAEVGMSIEGEGPVLVVDGEGMTDSVFLACYLDEIGDGPTLRPTEPYARWEMMTLCRQIIERCAPAAAFIGTKAKLAGQLAAIDTARFDQITAKMQSVDLAQRWADIRSGTFPEDQQADSETKIAQAVEKVEARLDARDWLMGDFSIADLETYAWLAGMVDLVPDAFANKPKTMAWLSRVAARPSVAKALSLAETGDPKVCWAPGPEINRWG